jgi:hypothetical protein
MTCGSFNGVPSDDGADGWTAKSGPSLTIIIYIRNIFGLGAKERATLDDGNESSDDFPCSGTLASRSSPIPIGKISSSMHSENSGMERIIGTVIPSTLDLILITLQRHAITPSSWSFRSNLASVCPDRMARSEASVISTSPARKPMSSVVT